MVKKICFIHTETTGLHELGNVKVYKKNLFGFARMVSFSYIIATRNNIEKKEYNIIKPRCLNIPQEIVQFHGISQEIAMKKGKDIEKVLDKFCADIMDCDIIISHSLDFHLKTVQAELIRYNKAKNFNKYILIDINMFEHNIFPSTLNNMTQQLLKKKIIDNKKENVIDIIAELFFILYNDYEKNINYKP